ncbi:MAG: hypothetical protein JWL65_6316 [Gammaproteobacteria bacterium]|nr:hypothetical protein [Gammaproteobacteria bacterium]
MQPLPPQGFGDDLAAGRVGLEIKRSNPRGLGGDWGERQQGESKVHPFLDGRGTKERTSIRSQIRRHCANCHRLVKSSRRVGVSCRTVLPLWLAVSGVGATPTVVVLLLALFSLVVVKFVAMLATTCAESRTAKEGRNMKTLVFASVMETIHALGASSWASGPLAKAAGRVRLLAHSQLRWVPWASRIVRWRPTTAEAS